MSIFRSDLYVTLKITDFNLEKSSKEFFQLLSKVADLRNLQMTKVTRDREIQGKIKIEEARIEAKVKAADQLYELDRIGAQDMRYSWKDEWFVVLLSIPFILCFIPPLAPYALEGFRVLSTTPEWYRWAFLGAIVASFGLRTWLNNFKGNV